ncbi:salivaricin M family lantibiotic [Anaerosporobacter sp.]|uniref:salivaricin M family lantibiotic n=1 Tax=Anaerosporobacter sp. TaxID=1872529 RepID=UPI00286F7987|nr:salivaricin M family lantibiotic [Anaerosporobacter sp.]
MSKTEMRNQYQEKAVTTNVVEEIKEQDFEGQVAGGGARTAVQLTMANKCGNFFTISYECTTPHKACA